MSGDQLRAINCYFCKNLALSRVVGEVVDEPETVDVEIRLMLLRCDSCGEGNLFRQIDYRDGLVTFSQVWPEERRPLSYEVPEELRDEHDEAVTCLQSGANTAAVVMVRRTLEGICKLNGTSKKTLFEGLRELHKAGKIDDRLMAWAEELRILGNQGAHYTGKKVSREDATDAIDFAEALLDYLYVLSAKFDSFKARRSSSAPSNSST